MIQEKDDSFESFDGFFELSVIQLIICLGATVMGFCRCNKNSHQLTVRRDVILDNLDRLDLINWKVLKARPEFSL